MRKIIDWVKGHKLATLLIAVVGVLAVKAFGPSTPSYSSYTNQSAMDYEAAPGTTGSVSKSLANLSSGRSIGVAPAPEAASRLVVTWSNLSLLVTNVSKTLKDISTYATSVGGYMVESNLSSPTEAASGDITIRVPSAKLDEVLTHLRSLAVRVVSENLSGEDVTDQYVDLDKRLAILNETMTRFEAIAQKAVTFSDILEANQQILNIQSEIEAIKGQQNYLNQTAAMAKITMYLSEDEYSLPYAPSEPWSPGNIFKQAVRSLVGTLRGVGTSAIWIGVYAVVIVPVILVIILITKVLKNRKNP